MARMHKESLVAQRTASQADAASMASSSKPKLLSLRSSGRFRRTPQVREVKKALLKDEPADAQTSTVAEK